MVQKKTRLETVALRTTPSTIFGYFRWQWHQAATLRFHALNIPGIRFPGTNRRNKWRAEWQLSKRSPAMRSTFDYDSSNAKRHISSEFRKDAYYEAAYHKMEAVRFSGPLPFLIPQFANMPRPKSLASPLEKSKNI